MLKRFITGTVLFFIWTVVVLFSDTPILPLFLGACSCISIYEIAGCVGLRRSAILTVPLYGIAGLYPFVIRYVPLLGVDDVTMYRIHFVTIICVLFYFLVVMTLSHGKYSIKDVAVLFTTSLYILLGFNAIMILRDCRTAGQYLYIAGFISAWITDIFAYFCGLLLGRGGRHKLIPDVSPKKTVEGAVGGVVFCTLILTLYGFLIGNFGPHGIKTEIWMFAIAGVLLSVVSQFGDLFMSAIKRHYGIKDYGKIFIGHGGVLDRFDSIIAVSIALAAFTAFFNLIKLA